MYKLNQYGKIVVNQKEVYYGYIIEIDYENKIAKLFLIDWRDRHTEQKDFQEMIAPLNEFTIKYEVGQ